MKCYWSKIVKKAFEKSLVLLFGQISYLNQFLSNGG